MNNKTQNRNVDIQSKTQAWSLSGQQQCSVTAVTSSKGGLKIPEFHRICIIEFKIIKISFAIVFNAFGIFFSEIG
jgi:hypothetical protein